MSSAPRLELTIDASCDCTGCCRSPSDFPVYVTRTGKVVRYSRSKDDGDAVSRTMGRVSRFAIEKFGEPLVHCPVRVSSPPMLSQIEQMLAAPGSPSRITR